MKIWPHSKKWTWTQNIQKEVFFLRADLSLNNYFLGLEQEPNHNKFFQVKLENLLIYFFGQKVGRNVLWMGRYIRRAQGSLIDPIFSDFLIIDEYLWQTSLVKMEQHKVLQTGFLVFYKEAMWEK